MKKLLLLIAFIFSINTAYAQKITDAQPTTEETDTSTILLMLTLDSPPLKEWADEPLMESVFTYFKGVHSYNSLPIVGIALQKNHRNLLDTIFNYSYAYEVPESSRSAYLGIISSINQVISNDSVSYDFLNLSLQPAFPYEFNELEAMNIATKVAALKGIVIGMAAGNWGGFGDNTLSPWSVAPWVIGVGATNTAGDTLWDRSSRGIKGSNLYHPTVVAPGINQPLNLSTLERDDLPDSTIIVPGGTSLAVPHLLGSTAQMIDFLDTLTNNEKLKKCACFGKKTYSIDIPKQKYPFAIRLLLEDMARPMEGYEKHEVGAGFVGGDIIDEYLENFTCQKLLFLATYIQALFPADPVLLPDSAPND
ncbi:MAG: S8/S53 family peptidase [Bacteroidota bacterium]